MNLIRIVIIIILIFNSCSTIGKKNSLYGKCKKGYLACAQFELKKDKTFEYYIFMDVGGGNLIKGSWEHVNKDTLKLNTFKQPQIKETYYIGEVNNHFDGEVKIQINDYEFPLGLATVELNDGEIKGILNEEGIGYFNVDEVRNITYSYLGDRQEEIDIKDQNLNDIKIFVKDLEGGVIPQYLVDELVLVTNKEIIFYPNSDRRKYRLKRNLLGKKYWK